MSEDKGVPGKYKIMVMKEVKWETVARYTDGSVAYEKVKELQLQLKQLIPFQYQILQTPVDIHLLVKFLFLMLPQ